MLTSKQRRNERRAQTLQREAVALYLQSQVIFSFILTIAYCLRSLGRRTATPRRLRFN